MGFIGGYGGGAFGLWDLVMAEALFERDEEELEVCGGCVGGKGEVREVKG